jgi:hypothetical protein
MDNNSSSSNQSIQIPSEVRTFISNLLEDAGITNLDDDLKEEMIHEVFMQLDKYITSVIVENMKTEDVEVFIKMNEDKKPQDEIQQYLNDKIPNAQEVMTKAFADFRDLYLGKVTVATQPPQPANPEENKNLN